MFSLACRPVIRCGRSSGTSMDLTSSGKRSRMKTGQLAALVFASGLTGFGMAGCAPESQTATTATAPAGSNVSQGDLAFITNAYNIVEFDRTIALQAQSSAHDPRVRALAADLVREAEAFRAKVKPVADAAGIRPPETLSFGQRSDLQERMVGLNRTGSRAYDRQFLEDEIATHQEALRRQQQMADDPGGNPQLKALAVEGTQILRTNLAKLQALLKQLPS